MDDELCGCGGRKGKHTFACVTDRYTSTLHKCALCSVVLYTGAVNADLAERTEAEHRKVCERRPVEVGDWVRWERRDGSAWVEGAVVKIAGIAHFISLVSRTPGWTPIGVREDGSAPFGTVLGSTIRRIPRPGQETVIRTPVGDITMLPDPTLEPGELRLEKPAPILHDGLTAAQCFAIYEQNMRHDQKPLVTLTPRQCFVAQEEWSAQLRLRADQAKERERSRVVVDYQDEP